VNSNYRAGRLIGEFVAGGWWLAQVVGDGLTLGGDFEEIAIGVCEIEKDFGWDERIAIESEAVGDLLRGRIAISGAGFEGAQNGAEGERGGGGFELGIIIGGEPIAEIGGAERDDAPGLTVGRHAGARLAVLGEERRGGAGVIEEGEPLIGLV
jgi:hypothetical protein